MLFNSGIFLFLFLPITLALYFLCKNKTYRNVLLFIVNIIFYAWGEPIFILLLLGSMIFNYVWGILIQKFQDSKKKSKALLITGLIANLFILIFFKYFMMLGDAFNAIIGLAGAKPVPILQIALPVGISFYTFQSLSYLIDVYRKDVKAQPNFIKYGLYIAFFPQLIAGPIVRYKDINDQIDQRVITPEKFADGVKRFVIGLGQKVIFANYFGKIADMVFDNTAIALGGAGNAWIGIICFTLQIFFDFAGYSAMAIGMAKMFGFDFPENFNYPYISKSIKEFWRRWHISLSSWFRDYIYIPMGGNRKGKARMYCGLLLIFVLCGLWHGANWTFLIWGLYHGIFLIIERLPFLQKLKQTPNFLKYIYTMFVVIIGWVFFRAPSIGFAFQYIGSMFFANGAGLNLALLDYKFILLFPLAVLSCTPICKYLKGKIDNMKNKKLAKALNIAAYSSIIVLLLICIPVVLSNTASPFIYFKF